MNTTRASASAAATSEPTPDEALASVATNEKPKLSPAERWLKIREKACLHSQKRGFLGGSFLDDWAAAEKEVDAKYDTDLEGSSITTPEQISSQIKCILTRYGLGHLSVDALLERHEEAMQRLATLDHTLIDGTVELAGRQTVLAQEALHEAVHTLQSVAQGKVDVGAMTKQAHLSMQAMENALSHLRAVAEAVTGISGTDKDSASKS